MKIDGAIFDLDGTLLDSMYIWDTIGEEYLRSMGIEPHEDLNNKFKSMSLQQAAEYYRSEYGVTQSMQEIMDGVNARIEHYYFLEALTKPGVVGLLQALSQRGVRMCVATATDRHLAEAALARNNLLGYFSEVFTCTQVGSGKDSPEIFEAALAHLGTEKQNTAVFEDALYAVRTAKAVGFFVIGVADASEAEHSGQIRALADIYLERFEEMEMYLDE